MIRCRRAPRGWFCTRTFRHAGPCATVPRWWNLYGRVTMWGIL